MACCSATVPATPTVSPPKGFKLPCSFCSSTNGFAAHSPTAASPTAPTPSTSRPASSKPPTTAPTTPFNRSSICSPPELTVTIVELFLSTILQGRIYYTHEPEGEGDDAPNAFGRFKIASSNAFLNARYKFELSPALSWSRWAVTAVPRV